MAHIDPDVPNPESDMDLDPDLDFTMPDVTPAMVLAILEANEIAGSGIEVKEE